MHNIDNTFTYAYKCGYYYYVILKTTINKNIIYKSLGEIIDD